MCYEDTYNTLKYAERAKSIKSKVATHDYEKIKDKYNIIFINSHTLLHEHQHLGCVHLGWLGICGVMVMPLNFCVSHLKII